jgi:hypothetical protein
MRWRSARLPNNRLGDIPSSTLFATGTSSLGAPRPRPGEGKQDRPLGRNVRNDQIDSRSGFFSEEFALGQWCGQRTHGPDSSQSRTWRGVTCVPWAPQKAIPRAPSS